MERWKLYALASAFFAGITAVIAKAGLKAVGADLSLALRTLMVFGFVVAFTLIKQGPGKAAATLQTLDQRSFYLLALSALATTLSWVCYFRAMEAGTVSYVSLIDKGSILVTLVFSVLLLGEPLTWRLVIGCALVAGGLLTLTWGRK